MRRTYLATIAAGLALALAACGAPDTGSTPELSAPRAAGEVATAVDTTIEAMLEAAGVAGPIAQATLSTKLMGTVTAVLVREGDRVTAGEALVRIDARDLAARQSQLSAAIAGAEAMHRDAMTQAGRLRALHADSAATRSQLDAAETGLARAEAAVQQARAGASELAILTEYSVVRAPFDGVVTRRLVDPGAFAAPGAPLVTVQDSRRLRVSATVAPEAARGLARGATIRATVEGVAMSATVEGVVPAPAGNVYTINAMVDNPGARLLSGSAATLQLPQGTRRAVVIPTAAVQREGDLTGVLVRGATGDELRWVRLGAIIGANAGDRTEVLGGLRAGDRVVVPVGVTPAPDVAADSGRN